MRSRTIEILDRQLTMVRDEKNRRCIALPVYTVDIIPSCLDGYNIILNKNNIVLSGIESMEEAESALAEIKALFFIE